MRILSAVCLILGCFLGAGFVSGREIVCYFSRFGNISYLTCILAGVLFFVLTIFFFSISKNIRNTSQFVKFYFNKTSNLIEWLFAICILILTGSMIAGTSVLAESLQYNKVLVVTLTLILSFFVVKNNVQGLSKVNNILVPVLLLVIILTMSFGNHKATQSSNVLFSVVSGGGYVFINIVSLGLLIIEIGSKYTKKEKYIISIICSIIITVLLLGVNHSIISNGLIGSIMPNLLLSKKNAVLYIIMQLSIYFGLFTTLISNVFLLSNFVGKFVNNNSSSIILSLFFGVLVSFCGFDNLIGYVYFFIGFVGVLIVLGMICKKRACKTFTRP